MKYGLTVYFNDKNGNKTTAWRSFYGTLEDGFDILANNGVNAVCLSDKWDEEYGIPDRDSACYWHWGDGLVVEIDGKGRTAGKYQKIGGKWTQTEKNGLTVEDIERTDRIMSEPVAVTEEIPMAV